MTQSLGGFHWIDLIVDKIISKHGVDPEEVERALLNQEPAPFVRKRNKRYLALAQVEDDGEYLFVVFDMDPGNVARVITARHMSDDEKSSFRKIRRLGAI
jgi:uncharacterized DUF497 family protein